MPLEKIEHYAFKYSPMPLGQVIDYLGTVDPAAVMVGMGENIFSYRGYYERNAVSFDPDNLPSGSWLTASQLRESYIQQIGKPITGWKGGDYTVQEKEYLYLVESERDVGYAVSGFMVLGNAIRPVVFDEGW